MVYGMNNYLTCLSIAAWINVYRRPKICIRLSSMMEHFGKSVFTFFLSSEVKICAMVNGLCGLSDYFIKSTEIRRDNLKIDIYFGDSNSVCVCEFR